MIVNGGNGRATLMCFHNPGDDESDFTPVSDAILCPQAAMLARQIAMDEHEDGPLDIPTNEEALRWLKSDAF